MNFIPFTSVGEFYFEYSIEIVKKIIKEEFIIGFREELGKKYPSLYIPITNVFIVFSENGNLIRTIEVENDVFFKNVNLFREPFINVKRFIQKNDTNYKDENEQIESQKYGLIVMKEKTTNTLTFYSKEYLKEDDISPDDIIKYFLE